MVEIPSRVLEGELVDDWYPLSGRQGDEKEGVINLILEYRVSWCVCVCVCVCVRTRVCVCVSYRIFLVFRHNRLLSRFRCIIQ